MRSTIEPTPEHETHTKPAKRLHRILWFIGLYAASLIVLGLFGYFSHALIGYLSQ